MHNITSANAVSLTQGFSRCMLIVKMASYVAVNSFVWNCLFLTVDKLSLLHFCISVLICIREYFVLQNCFPVCTYMFVCWSVCLCPRELRVTNEFHRNLACFVSLEVVLIFGHSTTWELFPEMVKHFSWKFALTKVIAQRRHLVR